MILHNINISIFFLFESFKTGLKILYGRKRVLHTPRIWYHIHIWDFDKMFVCLYILILLSIWYTLSFTKCFSVVSNSIISLLLLLFQTVSHSGSYRCGYILTLLYILSYYSFCFLQVCIAYYISFWLFWMWIHSNSTINLLLSPFWLINRSSSYWHV